MNIIFRKYMDTYLNSDQELRKIKDENKIFN